MNRNKHHVWMWERSCCPAHSFSIKPNFPLARKNKLRMLIRSTLLNSLNPDLFNLELILHKRWYQTSQGSCCKATADLKSKVFNLLVPLPSSTWVIDHDQNNEILDRMSFTLGWAWLSFSDKVGSTVVWGEGWGVWVGGGCRWVKLLFVHNNWSQMRFFDI